MNFFLIVIVLQLIVIAVVVYILKRLLDRDLVLSALERASGFQPSDAAIRTEKILIISAVDLPSIRRDSFISVFGRKCPRAEVEFLSNLSLMGGLVIEVAGEVWDHSLVNRIKHLFP